MYKSQLYLQSYSTCVHDPEDDPEKDSISPAHPQGALSSSILSAEMIGHPLEPAALGVYRRTERRHTNVLH